MITINETQATILDLAIEYCDTTRQLRRASLEENRLRSTTDDCEKVLRAVSERAELEQIVSGLEAELFRLTKRLQEEQE